MLGTEIEHFHEQKYNRHVITSYIPDSTGNDVVNDAQGTSIPFSRDCSQPLNFHRRMTKSQWRENKKTENTIQMDSFR